MSFWNIKTLKVWNCRKILVFVAVFLFGWLVSWFGVFVCLFFLIEIFNQDDFLHWEAPTNASELSAQVHTYNMEEKNYMTAVKSSPIVWSYHGTGFLTLIQAMFLHFITRNVILEAVSWRCYYLLPTQAILNPC